MATTATKATKKTTTTKNPNMTETDNGAVAYKSTLNACLDFFVRVGSERGNYLKGDKTIHTLFTKAFEEDAEIALRTLFWARDARKGAGERSIFRGIIHEFAKTHTDLVLRNLDLIPSMGRWDDLFALMGTPCQDDMLDYVLKSLDTHEDRNLLAKWVPRSKTKDKSKRLVFNILAKKSGLGKGGFRRKIAKLSNTVEQQMCAKDWSGINYETLPSGAQSKYVKAFYRNDGERYKEFINAVNKGEKKINTSTLMPHEIVRMTRRSNTDEEVANTLWANLSDVVPETDEIVLPVTDVSGSMDMLIAGNTTAMDVAVALSMYFAENNKGPIQNKGLTFSTRPSFYTIDTSLSLGERVRNMIGLEWGGSTNLQAVFEALLYYATEGNVPQEYMPTAILIMSDMQFDQATGRNWRNGGQPMTQTLKENIVKQYTNAGYTPPKLIFWNLNSNDNFPVKYDEFGTAMVSGFSPNILKSMLEGGLDNLSPVNTMLNTVNVERYDVNM